MALQDQVIPVHLGGGLDTKTNPKAVVVGKFLLIENATWTAPGSIGKRNGYTALPTAIAGGGSLVAPQMVRVFQSQLVCADQGSLYAYSPALSQWVKQGSYVSAEITSTSIYETTSAGAHIDSAVLGSVALYTWSDAINGSPAPGALNTWIAAYDLNTGTQLLSPTIVGSVTVSPNIFGSHARAVCLGGTQLAVTYLNSSSHLAMRLVNISGSSITYGSEIDISGASLYISNGESAFSPYDISATTSGALVVYGSTPSSNFYTQVQVTTLTTTGTVDHTAVISQAFTSGPFYGVQDGSGNCWVYFATNSASATHPYGVYYARYSSTLTNLNASTFVAAAPDAVYSICALPLSSTQAELFFSNAGGYNIAFGVPATQVCTITAGGSITSATSFLMGAMPVSRPFTAGGQSYALFLYSLNGGAVGTAGSSYLNQATFFIVNLTTGSVVSRFFCGNAGVNVSGALARLPTFSCNVNALSATRFLFACGETFQFLVEGLLLGGVGLNAGLVGVQSVTLEFSSPNGYRALCAGNNLILNGSVTKAYDGANCTELGFHLNPVMLAPVGTTGGSMAAGTYSYIAVFQWTDAQGNLEQSGVSNAYSVQISSSSNAITITVTCPYLTAKQNVNVAIYRTQASGSLYYLVTDPIQITLAPGASKTVSFTDKLADASLPGRQELYTTGNVLPNDPCPPGMVMESRQGRLWVLDSENRNTLWYSKTYSPGTRLSMSAALIVETDPKLGSLVALSEMDDKMIVLAERGNVFFAGDGANDTGTGVTLTTPQVLPGDGGCTSMKSVVLTPNGVFFKKQKGIYLLDRALQEHYVGAAVEAYNAQTITAATVLSSLSQVRFLTSSGSTLVYDYLVGQWSTFTNHQGYGADLYGGFYTYAKTDGKIYQEDTTGQFLDGSASYRIRAQLSWLALAGVLGFERVRRIALLGDFAGAAGHGVQVSAAYDYGSAFSSPVAYSFTGSAGTFQFRERLVQQKCEALSLLIEEVVTGASGESLSLSALALEAGVKRGINKLPPGQSLG